MKQTYILIDESGTLPDKNDQVIVLAAVIEASLNELELVIKSTIKKTATSSRRSELKFYTASNREKVNFFTLLQDTSMRWKALVCTKMNRSIQDSPHNYGILVSTLLKHVLKKDSEMNYQLIFDRHFHQKKDLDVLNAHIIRSFPFIRLRDISHVDSMKKRIVNVADMVAGALLAKEHKKDVVYYQKIKNFGKIIRVEWVDLHKKSLEPV